MINWIGTSDSTETDWWMGMPRKWLDLLAGFFQATLGITIRVETPRGAPRPEANTHAHGSDHCEIGELLTVSGLTGDCGR
jgi:hypothetical protein